MNELCNQRCDKQMFDPANQKLSGHVTYRIWREKMISPSPTASSKTHVKTFFYFVLFISILFDQVSKAVLKLYRSPPKGRRGLFWRSLFEDYFYKEVWKNIRYIECRFLDLQRLKRKKK